MSAIHKKCKANYLLIEARVVRKKISGFEVKRLGSPPSKVSDAGQVS